ncbi:MULTISPECIES: hypothetical protein [Ligilactobacillus]|nr:MULTISPECIES: hypothetical protein [Ligilactobacillus]
MPPRKRKKEPLVLKVIILIGQSIIGIATIGQSIEWIITQIKRFLELLK